MPLRHRKHPAVLKLHWHTGNKAFTELWIPLMQNALRSIQLAEPRAAAFPPL